MRIWSLHPKYLDAKGLVALWRETLLAKNVLSNKTQGYKSHPQLIRFKNNPKPLNSINLYLAEVYRESEKRGYIFDKDKIDWNIRQHTIEVTSGQMEIEGKHLLNKLSIRDLKKYDELKDVIYFDPHPLFAIVPGDIEEWEKTNPLIL